MLSVRIAVVAAIGTALVLAASSASGANAPGACAAKQLTVAVGPEVSPMTGEHAVLYVLRNRGTRSCTISGYPRVRLLDRRGRALPFRVARGRGNYVSHVRPRTLLLRPGRRAWFLVAKYRCDERELRPAVRMSLSLDGTLRAPVPAAAHVALCAGGRASPGNALQLSPFVPRRGAVGPAS